MQYLNFMSEKKFFRSIHLQIAIFVGFLTIINKLPQQQKK